MWGDFERATNLDGNDPLATLLFQISSPAHIPWGDARWQELLHGYDVWVHIDDGNDDDDYHDGDNKEYNNNNKVDKTTTGRQNHNNQQVPSKRRTATKKTRKDADTATAATEIVSRACRSMSKHAAMSSNLAALSLHVTRMLRELVRDIQKQQEQQQQQQATKNRNNGSSKSFSKNAAAAAAAAEDFSLRISRVAKARATAGALQLLRVLSHSVVLRCCLQHDERETNIPHGQHSDEMDHTNGWNHGGGGGGGGRRRRSSYNRTKSHSRTNLEEAFMYRTRGDLPCDQPAGLFLLHALLDFIVVCSNTHNNNNNNNHHNKNNTTTYNTHDRKFSKETILDTPEVYDTLVLSFHLLFVLCGTQLYQPFQSSFQKQKIKEQKAKEEAGDIDGSGTGTGTVNDMRTAITTPSSTSSSRQNDYFLEELFRDDGEDGPLASLDARLKAFYSSSMSSFSSSNASFFLGTPHQQKHSNHQKSAKQTTNLQHMWTPKSVIRALIEWQVKRPKAPERSNAHFFYIMAQSAVSSTTSPSSSASSLILNGEKKGPDGMYESHLVVQAEAPVLQQMMPTVQQPHDVSNETFVGEGRLTTTSSFASLSSAASSSNAETMMMMMVTGNNHRRYKTHHEGMIVQRRNSANVILDATKGVLILGGSIILLPFRLMSLVFGVVMATASSSSNANKRNSNRRENHFRKNVSSSASSSTSRTRDVLWLSDSIVADLASSFLLLLVNNHRVVTTRKDGQKHEEEKGVYDHGHDVDDDDEYVDDDFNEQYDVNDGYDSYNSQDNGMNNDNNKKRHKTQNKFRAQLLSMQDNRWESTTTTTTTNSTGVTNYYDNDKLPDLPSYYVHDDGTNNHHHTSSSSNQNDTMTTSNMEISESSLSIGDLNEYDDSLENSSRYNNNNNSTNRKITNDDKDENEDENENLTINFESLFLSFGRTLHTEVGALLLYTLFQSCPSFAESLAVRSDLDTLVMPLLRTLYFSSQTNTYISKDFYGTSRGKHSVQGGSSSNNNKNASRVSSSSSTATTTAKSIMDIRSCPFRSPSQLYVILILLLLFSQDPSFGRDAFRRNTVNHVLWYKERNLKNINLGSVLVLTLLRSVLFNLHRLQDVFLLSNCCAVLMNLSPAVVDLHDYAALRLASVTVTVLKKHAKLYKQHQQQQQGQSKNDGKPVGDKNKNNTTKTNDSDDDDDGFMSTPLEMYAEVSRTLLGMIKHCLSTRNLERNLHLVYGLVYHQTDFQRLLKEESSYVLVVRQQQLCTKRDVDRIISIIVSASTIIQQQQAGSRTAQKALHVLESQIGRLQSEAAPEKKRSSTKKFNHPTNNNDNDIDIDTTKTNMMMTIEETNNNDVLYDHDDDDEFTFSYEEEMDPEIFFIPYVWETIVCIVTSSSIEWKKDYIRSFELLDPIIVNNNDTTTSASTSTNDNEDHTVTTTTTATNYNFDQYADDMV